MWMMLQQNEPEDYVLATGKPTSVRQFLEICLKIAKIPFERSGTGKDEIYVDTRTGKTIVAADPHFYRPSEVDFLQGDASKAKAKLGWEAKTSVDELARIMMEADCSALGVSL
jgi:GDPmannose 4,6-dehydratase